MVELAVSMTVLLILTAMAIPSLMRSFRTYQLNDAAGRVSDQLKFTRFEAVRRNTLINCQIKLFGADWAVWTTPNGNTTPLATEKQILITGFVTLLPSGVPPSSATITATLGASNTLTTLSGANGFISFDARGAVSPLAAYVLYVGSATNPEYGYRAVILLPSGAVQIWTAPTAGPWQRIG
jgi:Tfp pilus assembly protein FimT